MLTQVDVTWHSLRDDFFFLWDYSPDWLLRSIEF